MLQTTVFQQYDHNCTAHTTSSLTDIILQYLIRMPVLTINASTVVLIAVVAALRVAITQLTRRNTHPIALTLKRIICTRCTRTQADTADHGIILSHYLSRLIVEIT